MHKVLKIFTEFIEKALFIYHNNVRKHYLHRDKYITLSRQFYSHFLKESPPMITDISLDIFSEVNKTDGPPPSFPHDVGKTTSALQLEELGYITNQLYEEGHPCDFSIWHVTMKLCRFIVK